VADVQYNRAVGIVGRLRARAVGRAKFVNAGSLRVGDALERYGDSRRPGEVQLSPRPREVGGRGTGMQPLQGSRRAVRLEERYGCNRCKVSDGSISPQRKPSRTLVTHRTTRAIRLRTTARSLSDRRDASPKPIEPIPNAWFRRKVRKVCVGGYLPGPSNWVQAGSMMSAGYQYSATLTPTRSSNHPLICKIRSRSTPVCSHTQPRCVALEHGLGEAHNAASSQYLP